MPASSARRASQCRYKQLLAAFFLTAPLSGCERSGESYFPLDSGLAWHYHIERTTMDGTATLKHVIEALPATEWRDSPVVPKATAAGEQYLYRRDGRGVHQVAYKRRNSLQFIPYASPLMVLPAATDGGSWQQPSTTVVLENTGPPWETLFRIQAPVELVYRVDSATESVEVPAGTFERCLKLVGSGETNVEVGNYIGRTTIKVEVTEWYAPGVGLVKSLRTERTTADAIDFGSLSVVLERFVN